MKIYSAAAFFVAVLVSLVHAQTAPTIASISNSQLLTQGESLSLSVSVNGTAPFTYAWKKAGSPIAGATASTYTIDAVSVTHAGSYTVTVTNATGSVTSGAILIDVTPATAPSFYGQPGNVVYTVGDTINLSAWISGTQPFVVDWKKGATIVATGSSTYYSKANAQAADAGTYTITVTNAAGTVTSSPFTVTVNALTAPVFYSSPSNVEANPGDYVSFYAYVTNSSGVTYQWYKDAVAIPNANYNSYAKSNISASDAGSYTLVATNTAGSSTSNPAVLTLRAATAPSNVTISSGPITVTTGETLSLYSSGNGTPPLTYQWRKDGSDIPGATSYTYYKSNVAADDTGTYSIVISNSVGSQASTGTSVSVSNAQVPIITFHPVSMTVYPGNSVSLSVSATGTGSLSFQWTKDGVVIPNSNSSYLWVSSSAATSDSAVYKVVVTNSQGSTTSQPATITVLAPTAPAITRQPSAVSLFPGESFHLSVEATGHPSPTYQWKKDNVDIAGATYNSYSKSNAASSDSGSYSVVVTNVAGTVTSQTATVTVGASTAPQIYGHPASGSLLLGDYSSYLSVYYSNTAQGTTVQWYRDGVAVPGATSSTYYISNAQPSHAGTYKAIVTNSAAQASTSYESVITVDLSSARPPITFTSGSEAIRGGSYAAAAVNISPAITTYTVVWKKDGAVVPNATDRYLNLANFSLALAGTYTAEVTANGSTYTSAPIVLSLMDSGASPRIVNHPASINRVVGEPAQFSVSAAGEQLMTYQWKKDGVDIPNATSDYYYIGTTTSANAGSYAVVVSNRNSPSATSDVAVLTITSASAVGVPILSQQPASQTLTSGNSYLNLSVGVLNWTNSETFKWYKDGVEISGANSSYYWHSGAVSAATAGRYKVSVTNAAGTTTSDEAIVSVTTRSTGPTFTTHPLSQSSHTGSSVTFSAAATSTSTVTYQWRKNGIAISGATSTSYTISNLQASDMASYTVVASDSDGSTASSVAELMIATSVAPIITTQPTSQVGGRGGSASFTVAASGVPTPGYQWKKNGTNISGATAATLSWTSLTVADEGSYSVVVTNSGGAVTSNSVSLTVFDQQPYAPAITSHPQGGAYSAAQTVTLTVGASGIPTPAIQWFKNGGAIAGAQSSTLSLGQMSAAHEGQYHAVASNVLGSATSSSATITLSKDAERLVNVSSRGVAGKDSNTLIAGFVISGSGTKDILLRAVGPTLTPLGVSGALPDPQVRLFKGSASVLENNDWSSADIGGVITAATNRLGAHPLAVGTKDAALMVSLTPGVYTAHVTTSDSSTGVALLEIYDADQVGLSTAKVVNLSTRGPVGTGDNILIVGFVVNGTALKNVLIRGIGPALTPLGVSGALADPRLRLFRGQTEINNNDNWSDGADAAALAAAAVSAGAPALPSGSKDSAILVALAPGVYSAHVRGVADTTGVALLEVYEVP